LWRYSARRGRGRALRLGTASDRLNGRLFFPLLVDERFEVAGLYSSTMKPELSQPPSAPLADEIPAEWLAEFEAAARRPLRTRFRYAFIHTYKPVLDDAPFRAFDTTADYRRWCEENLPDWLGYGRV
jgi:hypothetical protein